MHEVIKNGIMFGAVFRLMYAAFQGIILEDYKLTWERYTFLPGAVLLALFPVLYLVEPGLFSRPTSDYFTAHPPVWRTFSQFSVLPGIQVSTPSQLCVPQESFG